MERLMIVLMLSAAGIAGRSTVIIDPKGIIRKLFPSVKPTDHAREIHQTLKALQAE